MNQAESVTIAALPCYIWDVPQKKQASGTQNVKYRGLNIRISQTTRVKRSKANGGQLMGNIVPNSTSQNLEWVKTNLRMPKIWMFRLKHFPKNKVPKCWPSSLKINDTDSKVLPVISKRSPKQSRTYRPVINLASTSCNRLDRFVLPGTKHQQQYVE